MGGRVLQASHRRSLGYRRSLPELLCAQQHQVCLCGLLPCVSGLESQPNDIPDLPAQLQELFRSYPGPLTFRCSQDTQPPLDPGYLCADILPLSDEERLGAWTESLRRHDLPIHLAESMATRFRLEAGSIEQVCRQAALLQHEEKKEHDALEVLERTVRQHRGARMGTVAKRVERLASWSNVVLPSDVIDSLREFIGRARYRRTVLERWGFERLGANARGLTALFQGGAGTGKTMAAGLVASELGYELYRIDLGQVLSKWIGETEKNLGAVFDAAEEGEVVLLFDEADSIFSRRTEVRSSIDRYANIEVNYLLQRLDSFEGVAILTTNFGTAIDSAFKRRLSMRLHFPFPEHAYFCPLPQM